MILDEMSATIVLFNYFGLSYILFLNNYTV